MVYRFSFTSRMARGASSSLITLMGLVASVIVMSVIAETVGASGVFLVGKLVHSFAIALSTNLITIFADAMSMSWGTIIGD